MGGAATSTRQIQQAPLPRNPNARNEHTSSQTVERLFPFVLRQGSCSLPGKSLRHITRQVAFLLSTDDMAGKV